jgi:ergothioneine biosynthesis protein EgtB
VNKTLRSSGGNSRLPSVEASASKPLAADQLSHHFETVRAASEALAGPLSPEDQCLQSIEFVSPTKWHLAHTTWYFESFVLAGINPGYEPFHPDYGYLFNSYYNALGARHARPQRGLLSRPSVAEVLEYRHHVDEAIQSELSRGNATREIRGLLELGIHHEQQHQELILTDIKHAFSGNPLWPAYRAPRPRANPPHLSPLEWCQHDPGLHEIGHAGDRFAFDNERPRHGVQLNGYALASRCVSCGEFLEFMQDGGYERPELWLSDGWDTAQREGWQAPGHWQRQTAADPWQIFTLHGPRGIYEDEPVTHVSFFEADAYARWTGWRLPTEAEWEVAAEGRAIEGNFVESGVLHPRTSTPSPEGEAQLFGDVWEWTASPYVAYPGYRAPHGPLGEYNGKFMCNQLVLRGGSCATPASHLRASYRNFFGPEARWQFSGIRLARDID